MAQTPFKGTLVMRPAVGGPNVNLRFSASDVANALATFDDLGAATNFSVPVSSGGYVVEDIILSAAGVDTTQLQIRKQTADTTIILRDSLLASTTVEAGTRTQGLRGMVFGAGSQYGLKQLA